MAINTHSDVEDRIDAALVWRRIEMLALRNEVERAAALSSASPLARALARAGVAMLYAHWEGFFKEACQAYLDFVAKRKPKVVDLNDGLLLSVLDALHKRMSSGDDVGAAAMLEAVRTPTVRARIPRQIINTKSNLRHEVAADILFSIGLEKSLFMTRSVLINKSLCDARNTIAHGRELFPSAEEIVVLHAEILQMMEDLRDVILGAARTGGYRVLAAHEPGVTGGGRARAYPLTWSRVAGVVLGLARPS